MMQKSLQVFISYAKEFNFKFSSFSCKPNKERIKFSLLVTMSLFAGKAKKLASWKIQAYQKMIKQISNILFSFSQNARIFLIMDELKWDFLKLQKFRKFRNFKIVQEELLIIPFLPWLWPAARAYSKHIGICLISFAKSFLCPNLEVDHSFNKVPVIIL